MTFEKVGKRYTTLKGAFKPARYRVWGREAGVPFSVVLRSKEALKKLQNNPSITHFEYAVLN